MFFNIDIDKLLEQFRYHPEAPLLFNSGFFLLLFTGFLWLYTALSPTHRTKMIYVIIFSLYFYYKSSGMYFTLLLIATVVDFTLAKLIFHAEQRWRKKFYIVLTLLVNLGMLAYFKYTNFVLDAFFSFAGGVSYEPLDIFLPVGVSFFTFQSLSYTIDVYRGKLKPVDNIIDYAFFVSFFPQLVAGPIVRASEFLPQIHKPTVVTREMFGHGIFLIGCGLFKKAVISDYISINFVDRVFESPALYSGVENLLAVYGYALQIYCDFSGYSDMAIGIALLLGFHFPKNFDSPYQSASITEFWRRWHMTLSRWLRDYLYISLGGNRKGRVRTYVNLMVTMLLGGLWHGASWRFIIWGGLHGAALAVHRKFREWSEEYGTIPEDRTSTFVGALMTFHFVCFTWIFFRAPSMEKAGQMLTQIFLHFNAAVIGDFLMGYQGVMIVMLAGYFLHFIPRSVENAFAERLIEMHFALKAIWMVAIIVLVMQIKSAEIQPFIYFQF